MLSDSATKTDQDSSISPLEFTKDHRSTAISARYPLTASMAVIFSIFTKNTERVAVFHTRFSISALIRCSLFPLILKNWRFSQRAVQPGPIQTMMMDVRANNQPQFMLSHVDRTPAGTLHVMAGHGNDDIQGCSSSVIITIHRESHR